MEKLYLAADSGGSKTLWRLVDDGANPISEFTTLGLGAVESGVLPVAAEIEKAYMHFSPYGDISGIFLSLGGANTAEIGEHLEKYWKKAKIKVEREAVGDAILFGASFLGASSVVMCGTGSVAVGNTKSGRKFCGGWGPVYGDGGSGTGVGTSAVKMYLRSIDGFCDAGKLSELFENERKDLDISDFFGRMELKKRIIAMSRREVASLAPKIYELALGGDEPCIEIYREAAKEIALMANAVSQKQSKVLLCGGFFANKPEFLEMCKAELSKLSENIEPVYYKDFSPIVSSTLAVLKLCGIEITKEILEKTINI